MKPKTTEEERKKQKENEPMVNAKFSKVDKIQKIDNINIKIISII